MMKKKLLALHGKNSSSTITRLQLRHLGLDAHFDITCLDAPFVTGYDHETAEPRYSWIVGDMDEIKNSLRFILDHLRLHGPYHAIYGFSQGGALVSLLCHWPVRQQIMAEMNIPLDENEHMKYLFHVAFLVCAANVAIWNYFALDDARISEYHPKKCFVLPIITTPCVHFIGLTDEWKLHSEAFISLFHTSIVIYLSSGHEIPACAESDKIQDVMEWIHQNDFQQDSIECAQDKLEVENDSNLVSIHNEIIQTKEYMTKIDPTVHVCSKGQVVFNTKIRTSSPSIMDIIQRYAYEDDKRVLLYSSNGIETLTYKELHDFIRGPADFSKLIHSNVIARPRILYLSAVGVSSAVTFLTVVAQGIAIPIDPACTINEFQRMLRLTQPSIVLIFQRVHPKEMDLKQIVLDSPGVILWLAQTIPHTCGLFTIESSHQSRNDCHDILYLDDVERGRVKSRSDPYTQNKIMENTNDNNDLDVALILLTSGTTSLPKVVPLAMNSIVSNAFNIASSLGLLSSDIALNAMPLFHIGGLSSNLLSSLVMGAGVIIMPRFDADAFLNCICVRSCESSTIKIDEDHRSSTATLPKPTWYSAVPTMHSIILALARDQILQGHELNHSLRFIRTGAAPMDVRIADGIENTFKCPLVQTYSMTEQMPIAQPPNIGFRKPQSVGQPLVTGLAIVDSSLKPLSFHETSTNNGEICISCDLIVSHYESNKEANLASYFWMGGMRWFRTGDVGFLDSDGFLYVRGRIKDIIKRGGEQINPLEVEEILKTLDGVDNAVVFPVPDSLWGESVGAAIVLKPNIHLTVDRLKMDMRSKLIESLQPFCIPDFVTITDQCDIPKTSTGKFRRSEMANHFGLGTRSDNSENFIDPPICIQGLRFLLALAVCYVHIGSFGQFSNHLKMSSDFSWTHSRSWCFHTPLFFFLGGFFMSHRTRSEIASFRQYSQFLTINLLSLHPIYLISILWCTLHWIAMCRPSNFMSHFIRDRQPINDEYIVCQGTPVTKPWGITLFTSLLIYVFGLQSWPMSIYLSWFLSSYTWFSSVYYFCIMIFPICHRQLFRSRTDVNRLWRISFAWIILLYVYMAACAIIIFAVNDNQTKNYLGLGAYLLPVGWLPCFALGISFHFFYQYYDPRKTRRIIILIGVITDVLSLSFLCCWLVYGLLDKSVPTSLRADSLSTRLWDAFLSRILHPVGILWFCGLLCDYGWTAKLLSLKIFSVYLAPISYNMFLFHQPVSELYFFATRQIWWRYPKTFYWFSPYPVPVFAWEFPLVVLLVMLVSYVMHRYVNEWLLRLAFLTKNNIFACKRSSTESVQNNNTLQILIRIATMLSIDGGVINRHTKLSSAGISSLMSVVFVNRVNAELSRFKRNTNNRVLTINHLSNLVTLQDVADIIDDNNKGD